MELLTSFYFYQNNERNIEIKNTFESNLSKDFIKKLNIFISQEDFLKFNEIFKNNLYFNKVNSIIFNRQPTYKDLFLYSINIKNKIICICNSDIEFKINEEDLYLLDKLKNKKNIFFITRHENENNKPLIDNYIGSHDAFIFHSDTLKKNSDNFDNIDYKQNTLGIEAILILFFKENLNYELFNPCYQIKLIHNHLSKYRTYNKYKIIGYVYSNKINKERYKDAIHCKYLILPKIFKSSDF